MVYPNYYYRYNNYYNRRMTNYNLPKETEPADIPAVEEHVVNEHTEKRISPKRNSFANLNFSNLFSSNLEEPILEILGIKLYFDDILIIGLLFFLYNEGVKDEFLFISLILLLLS